MILSYKKLIVFIMEFLESMCAMDCAPFVKAVASPLSGSAFVQVTPTVLSYC